MTNTSPDSPRQDSPQCLAAIEYAHHGYGVVPAHWIYPDQKCSCRKPDCSSAGKHPIEKGWKELATLDPGKIKWRWTRNPSANVAVPCGKANDLTVLDVDGDVGRDTLHELQAKHGALPETPIVITGSGGNLSLLKT
jgi:putative DNA primase/helicase